MIGGRHWGQSLGHIHGATIKLQPGTRGGHLQVGVGDATIKLVGDVPAVHDLAKVVPDVVEGHRRVALE
eukprot:4650581-Prymnesium_polylepis.1